MHFTTDAPHVVHTFPVLTRVNAGYIAAYSALTPSAVCA